jgi:hypothetical protein
VRKAIRDVFGEHALVHRCHRHKERNVGDLLPELARDRLELLAGELDRMAVPPVLARF